MSIDIPAVVINLARSRDRRTHMEAQLKGRGLDYHFFDATDGYALNSSERALMDEQATLAWMRRPMLKEEMGCALSHIRIYEWMVKENIERLLVMEDDLAFKANFFQALREWDTWVPSSWDMINLATTASHPFSFSEYCAHRAGPKLRPLAALPDHTLIYCIHTHLLTSCYALTYKAATRLLALAYPVRMVADYLTGQVAWHRLKVYATLPPLVWAQNLHSTIQLEAQRTQLSGTQLPYARQARQWDRKHNWRCLWIYVKLGFGSRSVRKELGWRLVLWVFRWFNAIKR